jgi:hypothetical protein
LQGRDTRDWLAKVSSASERATLILSAFSVLKGKIPDFQRRIVLE